MKMRIAGFSAIALASVVALSSCATIDTGHPGDPTVQVKERRQDNVHSRIERKRGRGLPRDLAVEVASDEGLDAFCREHHSMKMAERLSAAELNSIRDTLVAGLAGYGIQASEGAVGQGKIVIYGCMIDSVYITILVYGPEEGPPYIKAAYRFFSYDDFVRERRARIDAMARDLSESAR
jgi:hypothetical protein